MSVVTQEAAAGSKAFNRDETRIAQELIFPVELAFFRQEPRFFERFYRTSPLEIRATGISADARNGPGSPRCLPGKAGWR